MKSAPLVDTHDQERSPEAIGRSPRAFGAAAVKTALLVGTILTLINHPQVVRLQLTPDLVAPCLLNYLVPFLVAGYSRHTLLRQRPVQRTDR